MHYVWGTMNCNKDVVWLYLFLKEIRRGFLLLCRHYINVLFVVQSLSHVHLCEPMGCSIQAPLFSTISQSLLRFMSIESVMLSNYLILLLLPSIIPSIKVFPDESALHIGWKVLELQPKGLSRVFSSTTTGKHQFFGAQPSLWSSSHICT